MKREALTLPEEALQSLPSSSVLMENHPANGSGTPFYDHLKVATDGRGKISIYPVFPGIELSWLLFQAGQASFHHAASPHVLEISYCYCGRVGWDLKEGMSVYLGAGDLTLHSTDCCADSVMRFPLGCYEGITLSIDLDRLSENCPCILREAGLKPEALYEKFCVPRESCALPACEETEWIFAPLCGLPEPLRLPYFKLKAQELLLYLDRLDPSAAREKSIARYSSSQTELIREIHDRLTRHPEQRFTIEELSREYLINTSSLKSLFKAVYGQPIAAYMKEYRIHRAMELLRQSEDPISQIAAALGYESAGKFTRAFQDVAHVLPSEYRKQVRGQKLLRT